MDPITLALAKKYTDKKIKEGGGTLTILKVYDSIDSMNNGFTTDGVPEGGLVLINADNVDDADNAKLYVKGKTAYEYLTDLSGSPGIQGPKGDTGETGPQGPQGEAGHTPVKGTDYFTAADKTELVNSVLAALPAWEGGSY